MIGEVEREASYISVSLINEESVMPTVFFVGETSSVWRLLLCSQCIAYQCAFFPVSEIARIIILSMLVYIRDLNLGPEL